jgi:hypothetical protein
MSSKNRIWAALQLRTTLNAVANFDDFHAVFTPKSNDVPRVALNTFCQFSCPQPVCWPLYLALAVSWLVLSKNSVKDPVDVSQVSIEAEDFVDFCCRQMLRDVGILR